MHVHANSTDKKMSTLSSPKVSVFPASVWAKLEISFVAAAGHHFWHCRLRKCLMSGSTTNALCAGAFDVGIEAFAFPPTFSRLPAALACQKNIWASAIVGKCVQCGNNLRSNEKCSRGQWKSKFGHYKSPTESCQGQQALDFDRRRNTRFWQRD